MNFWIYLCQPGDLLKHLRTLATTPELQVKPVPDKVLNYTQRLGLGHNIRAELLMDFSIRVAVAV